MKNLKTFINDAIHSQNVALLTDQYKQQSEMLVIEDFLPPEFVKEHYVPEVEYCSQYVHRVNVRGFKKSGSVSYNNIKRHAPNLFQLYRLEIMKDFIQTIVGKELMCCPERDSHATALYYYTEPGDRIKVHYDKSFYRGKRYTVLLGMIQNSEHSKLVCYPGATKRNMKMNPVAIATHPGTLIIFNGDTLWHEVTPLSHQERRVILTMEYITDTRMTFLNKLISDFKDRFLYFGKAIPEAE